MNPYRPLTIAAARSINYSYNYLYKIYKYTIHIVLVLLAFGALMLIPVPAWQLIIIPFTLTLFIGTMIIVLLVLWRMERKDYQRVVFIMQKSLPVSVWEDARLAHWTAAQRELVELGLREWILLNSRFPRQHLVLPSQQVALLWQVLSEDAEYYHRYCSKAFGKNNPLPYQQSSIVADGMIETEQEKSLAYTWLAESFYRDRYHQTNTIYNVKIVAPPLYGVPPLFAIDGLIQGQTQDWQRFAQHYQDRVQRYWQPEEEVFYYGLTKIRVTKGIIPR